MLVVTVTGALSAEIVALHTASKTLTATDCSDVNFLADSQNINSNFLANLETIYRVETQLDKTTTRRHVC